VGAGRLCVDVCFSLVARHSGFDKLHSALVGTILFIFPHRDLRA